MVRQEDGRSLLFLAAISADGWTRRPVVYASLDGDVPVVKVAAALTYPSVLGVLGLDPGLCLRAESETAVAGL